MPIEIRALKRAPKPEEKSEKESQVTEVTESKKSAKGKKEQQQKTKQKEAPPPTSDQAPQGQKEQQQKTKQKEAPPSTSDQAPQEQKEQQQKTKQKEAPPPTSDPAVKQSKKSKKKSKKPRETATFLEVPPDFLPPATPPELVPAGPVDINHSGKFYQAIAQLSGVVIAVDGLLHLQLPTVTIKLRGTKYHKSRLLSRLGTTVGIKGWISHSGNELQILKVCEPPAENIIALAGMVKQTEEEEKILLIVPRNAPVETKYFHKFIVTLSEPLRPKTKFLRCLATFNDEGALTVEKITASSTFLPKFLKDGDKQFTPRPVETTD